MYRLALCGKLYLVVFKNLHKYLAEISTFNGGLLMLDNYNIFNCILFVKLDIHKNFVFPDGSK